MGAVEARLSAIEARLAALESGAGAKSSSSDEPTDTLPFDKLSEHWADKAVARVPKNWSGRAVVGLMYSDLTSKECRALAHVEEFKAKMGRAENPVRMNNRGKPWHESNSFEAKLLRTWAKFKDENPDRRYGTSGHGANAKHTEPPESDPFDGDVTSATDDEIPF